MTAYPRRLRLYGNPDAHAAKLIDQFQATLECADNCWRVPEKHEVLS